MLGGSVLERSPQLRVQETASLPEGMDDLVLQHASETDEDFLMYTSTFCPYCVAAKRLFASKGLTYREINFDRERGMQAQVVRETGHRTVPVILDLRGEQPMFIGGFDETSRYLA